jgi:hypothetical protein
MIRAFGVIAGGTRALERQRQLRSDNAIPQARLAKAEQRVQQAGRSTSLSHAQVGWKPLVTVAVGATVLLSVGLVQTYAGWSAAKTLGIAAPADSFTELYFTQPDTLGYRVTSRPPRVNGGASSDASFSCAALGVIRVSQPKLASGAGFR